jgi:hypothetical protein
MTSILTTSEAATVLRCETNDPDMLALLPAVDAYLKTATGHDWTNDVTVSQAAKNAARILLVQWHENPGMTGQNAILGPGLTACIVQLKALALLFVNFRGRAGAGPIYMHGSHSGDTVESVIGLIGSSGDQSESFEEVITISGQIQQVSNDDLSENWYRVKLKPLEDL